MEEELECATLLVMDVQLGIIYKLKNKDIYFPRSSRRLRR